MKRTMTVLLMTLLWFQLTSCSENSPAGVASSASCSQCHFESKESIGPSLQRIRAVYADTDDLERFVSGEMPPRVDPSRSHAMEPFRMRWAELSAEKRDLLSGWIMNTR